MERLDCGARNIVRNIVMGVLKNWTRPRILPFVALFFLYAFTRPMSYAFLHEPVAVVIIKTASMWYLIFYVQIIKDMSWLPASSSSKVKDESFGENRNPTSTLCKSDGTWILERLKSFVPKMLWRLSRTESKGVGGGVGSSTKIEKLGRTQNSLNEDIGLVERPGKDVLSSVFVIHQNIGEHHKCVCLNNTNINNNDRESDDFISKNDDHKECDDKIVHCPYPNEKYSNELSPFLREIDNDFMVHNQNKSQTGHYYKKESNNNNNNNFICKSYTDDNINMTHYNTDLLQHTTHPKTINQSHAPPNDPSREEGYKQYFTLALVISSMGDAFMIFPSTFIPGVLSYGSAHLLSIVGFQSRFTRPRFSWLIYPYNAFGVLSILVWIRSIQMAFIILVYAMMLTTVMFYALSNLETRPSIQSLLAAIGAAFYVWSDTMIAYDKWIFELPFRDALVWSTYFFAQMNLALSI